MTDETDAQPPATLYVWVTRQPDGSPSMIGMVTEYGHTPAMTVREDFALGPLRSIALSHHEDTGQPVWLMRYRADAVLETHE